LFCSVAEFIFKFQYLFFKTNCKIFIIKAFKDHNDSELILLWQQGNDGAFEAVYKRYSMQLLGIAMQKTGDRETARELVQETFLVLVNNKSASHQLTSLIAYLYTILKNKILDAYKHNLVHQKFEDHHAYRFNEADNSTTAWIESRELEKRLNEEIEKLPPQCGRVFILSRKNYLSNKEIASFLQISENTVEQHMRKALRILRGSLSHFEKVIIIFPLKQEILWVFEKLFGN
jgi:RNA polymerase sigma-70 factor (family 1)